MLYARQLFLLQRSLLFVFILHLQRGCLGRVDMLYYVILRDQRSEESPFSLGKLTINPEILRHFAPQNDTFRETSTEPGTPRRK